MWNIACKYLSCVVKQVYNEAVTSILNSFRSCHLSLSLWLSGSQLLFPSICLLFRLQSLCVSKSDDTLHISLACHNQKSKSKSNSKRKKRQICQIIVNDTHTQTWETKNVFVRFAEYWGNEIYLSFFPLSIILCAHIRSNAARAMSRRQRLRQNRLKAKVEIYNKYTHTHTFVV